MMRRLHPRLSALKFTVSLFLIYMMLRFLRAETIIRYMPGSGSNAAPDSIARRFSAGIQIAAGVLPFATCLPQAILARYVLGRRGYDAAIHIGVRTVDGTLTAHAWTMSGRRIVSGGPESVVAQFKPIKVIG